LLRLLSRPSYCDFSPGELPLKRSKTAKEFISNSPTQKTVAAVATAEKSAHVVLRCITRSKTIATPMNGSLIVRPILSKQRHYIKAVHRDDKRTALAFGVACLTRQNVTRQNIRPISAC